MATSDPSMKWVWRGGALAAVVIGWMFILFHNGFHITPPVVFVCLGYFAAVATIYNLFRTGVAAVSASTEDEGENAWGKPMGPRVELEREKRTLLKAIKEAEFDFQMGKLSKRDSDEMIRTYRLRAIEVIKALDETEAPAPAVSIREQIEREIKARVEVEGKARKKGAADAEKKQEKQQDKQAKARLTKKQRREQEAARVAAKASASAADAKTATAVAAGEAAALDDDEDAADEAADEAADDAAADAVEAKDDAPIAPAPIAPAIDAQEKFHVKPLENRKTYDAAAVGANKDDTADDVPPTEAGAADAKPTKEAAP